MIGLLDRMDCPVPQPDPTPDGRWSDQGVRRALVVFEHRPAALPLRLLRPGFRHCYCLTGKGHAWILCDPLKTRIELMAVPGLAETDLVRALAGEGSVILRGVVAGGRSLRPMRLRTMTCVEVVKRVLNVDLPWALTPYQLYRSLLHPSSPQECFELA